MLQGRRCMRCRKERYFLDSEGVCDECKEIASAHAKRLKTERIILTTGIDVPGREIEAVVGIVASETALGLSIFKDIANNWRDFLGGRASTAQTALKEARQSCLAQMKEDASALDADAVISIDLDYNELSTTGNGILFVAASGTAVKLRPVTKEAGDTQ